jgi:hypothetical protein
MGVILLGNNSSILTFFSQSLQETSVRVMTDQFPVYQLISREEEAFSFLIVDVNDPIPDFAGVVHFLKKKFPGLLLWAIFDSESNSLRHELKRIGFEKIISYQDKLSELIQEARGDP